MTRTTDLSPARPSALSRPPSAAGVRVDGKFLADARGRRLVRGVSYGTFAPDAAGDQFPAISVVRDDFARMAEAGIDTVRVYTPPREALLDAAAEAGLGVMVGIPWTQHVAFLDSPRLRREARREVAAQVRRIGPHPATRLVAVGNEIPPAVVRWHGHRRVERFLGDLADAAHDACPGTLVTYVNFPPTGYLDLDAFDVCAFNVYLHRERDLRAYLDRLQHLAGHKPLLLAEAGADSLREGEDGQARITAMHVRAAFEAGCCGAIAFAWTDEWWRGGQDVLDWRFGLVDAARRPKPALAAVARAFAEAPFAPDARMRWPRVSVVVCAYNAADTLEDCLTSLERLTYPDYDVLVIDDGSTDATAAVAARHAIARVVSIPNGGLSAARNLGWSLATGTIVAYTDADVRVDSDWLTYLVQPLLDDGVVGCGGPNVVPADDPDLAQCVARAPGGPTHVLLDDRVAEHVPGCNMAFRRDALAAVGGFNPIYLRAGDDVDVCWRLQAAGGRIGFAPAALVWHHHRASIGAYWRQQVGYGEGEAWLRHQHPDKFSGGHIVWHGRIYSPLPFVRALTRMRMDTGVWGLAPFPSVYHTGAEPWTYLPHSAPWYLASWLATLAGVLALTATGHPSAGWLLLLAGLAASGVTLGRCVRYARRSDLRGLIDGGGLRARARATRLRAIIAWLHYLQPLARLRGRLRGHLEPPALPAVAASIPESLARPAPWPRDLWTALRLLGGASVEDASWSERWLGADRVLAEIVGALRRGRLSRRVDIADGWEQRRDVSIDLGRWATFDLAVLTEEHAGGRVLVRRRVSVRPRPATVLTALGAVGAVGASAVGAFDPRWPAWAAVMPIAIAVALLGLGGYRTAAALAGLRGVVGHALERLGALPVPRGRGRLRLTPDVGLWRHAARSVMASLVLIGGLLGSGLLVRDAVETALRRIDLPPAPPASWARRDPAVPRFGLAVAPDGDLYLADARDETLRRVSTRGLLEGPAAPEATPILLKPEAPGGLVTGPGGVALAPRGDLYIADTESHRVYRVDRVRGTAVVVAGNGHAGFGGDGGAATAAMLSQPAAVAVDRHGNLFIADTGNHRVRRVSRRTGLITTLVGGGRARGTDDDRDVGDGGPASRARLAWPTDLSVAPNGDLYIADTGHHRIRRWEARTGRVTTVAGTGEAGASGDGVPATQGRLSSPTGVAVAARGRQVTLYVADSSNGRVRVVTPDGRMATLALPTGSTVGSPARVAYHPRGYLYVAGAGRDALTAVSLRGADPVRAAARAARPPAPGVRRAM